MALSPYVCTNCGFWQRHFAVPAGCPVCEDHRHVLPDDGYEFLSPQLTDARGEVVWDEPEPGVWRFAMTDPIGIGPMGYMIEHPEGNVAFEGAGWYSDAALDFIDSLGGLRVATASHPHSFGALWRLTDRFGPEVPLHVGDLGWATAFTVTEPYDTTLALAHDLALHHTGAHFAGHQVLHDARRGILFSGDALKLELDPADDRCATGISCHKAFVRGVPLSHAELASYRDVFAPLDFTQTWTPFEQGANAGRAAALALLDGQLGDRPHADFVAVEPEPGK
jgi:hypothetical protein